MSLMILDKGAIAPLVNALMADYRIVGPQAKGPKFAFGTITDPARLPAISTMYHRSSTISQSAAACPHMTLAPRTADVTQRFEIRDLRFMGPRLAVVAAAETGSRRECSSSWSSA